MTDQDHELVLEVKNYTQDKTLAIHALLATIAGDFTFTLRWEEEKVERKTFFITILPRPHLVGRRR